MSTPVYYIVRHKNPKVPETKNGTEWTTDGLGAKWTQVAAEQHAARCEFVAHGIPFEVLPLESKRLRDGVKLAEAGEQV